MSIYHGDPEELADRINMFLLSGDVYFAAWGEDLDTVKLAWEEKFISTRDYLTLVAAHEEMAAKGISHEVDEYSHNGKPAMAIQHDWLKKLGRPIDADMLEDYEEYLQEQDNAEI